MVIKTATDEKWKHKWFKKTWGLDVNEYFEIDKWEFGETFYFSELASYIHSNLSTEIDSIVFVPTGTNQVYGDLQQIFAKEDEVIQPSIAVDDVEIVDSLNPKILRQTL